MLTLPALGLALALLGVPALLLANKLLEFNQFGLGSRLGLWALAIVLIAITVSSVDDWRTALGLSSALGSSILYGLLAALLILVAWPVIGAAQRLLGGTSTENTTSFNALATRSLPSRSLLVLTAGVTEEIVFRGYGIGVGQTVIGGTGAAVCLSLLVFVAAHFRWGVSHLLSVLWAGTILSLLFALTNSLLACIVAHLTVDAVGILLAPWAMAQKVKSAPVAPRDA